MLFNNSSIPSKKKFETNSGDLRIYKIYDIL